MSQRPDRVSLLKHRIRESVKQRQASCFIRTVAAVCATDQIISVLLTIRKKNMSAPAIDREPTEHNDTSKKSERSKRARRIIQCEVNFIYSAEFERPGAERRILEHSASQVPARRRRKAPSDVPGHLRHLWEIPLLSPDEETDLFRRMNYLKHRSNVLRSRLNPARPNASVHVCMEVSSQWASCQFVFILMRRCLS